MQSKSKKWPISAHFMFSLFSASLEDGKFKSRKAEIRKSIHCQKATEFYAKSYSRKETNGF